jgi:hypothetical protein
MNMRLNLDFQTAGQEGSLERRIFVKDLKVDLATASGLATSLFNILKVHAPTLLCLSVPSEG